MRETDRQLREVTSPVSVLQCAWQDSWSVLYCTVLYCTVHTVHTVHRSSDESVITYDRLSQDEVSGGTGGLNISTGVFTVGPGLREVTSVET